jgi:hypothetical protein|eukprot:COSAG01_NODE_138_length_24329_cov_45.428229_12_plen_54_part_00
MPTAGCCHCGGHYRRFNLVHDAAYRERVGDDALGQRNLELDSTAYVKLAITDP